MSDFISTPPYYKCYFCNFSTDSEDKYVAHGAVDHLYKPIFPSEVELAKYGLRPQGKPWEKCKITETEAEWRLWEWAEKRKRKERANQAKSKIKIMQK